MSGEKGIDIARYQGVMDWPQVKRAGIIFAMIKAQGSVQKELGGWMHHDPWYRRHCEGADSQGILWGPYGWFNPGDGANAAKAMFAATGRLEANRNLLPMADIEPHPLHKPFTKEDTRVYIEELKQLYQVHPLVYIAQELLRLEWMKEVIRGCFLCIPDWTPPQPEHPNMIMWQYTNNFKIPGRTDGVDGDMIVPPFDLDDLILRRIQPEGIRPMFDPPLGPFVANLRDKNTGAVMIEVAADGSVFVWDEKNAQYYGPSADFKKKHLSSHAIADIHWITSDPKDGYNLRDVHGHLYEFSPRSNHV